jgi:hypothetical protein
MRRIATWSVLVFVVVVTGVAIVAAIVNDDSPSGAHAVGSNSATDMSFVRCKAA